MKVLEEQALTPMYGDHPIELGLKEGDAFLPMLRADPKYQTLFARAFPDDKDLFTRRNVTRAIASFERSIISGRSPYDRYHFDRDDTAIPPAAKHGEALFFSSPLSCFRCHGGFDFSGATVSEANPNPAKSNSTTRASQRPGPALLSRAERRHLRIHESAGGRREIQSSNAPEHRRNRALYARRQHRNARSCSRSLRGRRTHHRDRWHAGIGHDNPNKDPIIGGFPLTAEDRANLIAFLQSLTDRELLNDPTLQQSVVAGRESPDGVARTARFC